MEVGGGPTFPRRIRNFIRSIQSPGNVPCMPGINQSWYPIFWRWCIPTMAVLAVSVAANACESDTTAWGQAWAAGRVGFWSAGRPHAVFNRKRAFSAIGNCETVGNCDRKSRKVPEGETAAEDAGRWNCGGLQRLVTPTFMLPF
jgi:hypothetical protein